MLKRNKILNNPDWDKWIPTLKNIDLTRPLVFDIETNGLFNDVTTIYALCIKDFVTGKMYSLHEDKIQEGLKLLEDAPIIVGHNIICYDIPVLKKLYPSWKPKGRAFDTLNACRLIWQDIKNSDYALAKKRKDPLPSKLIGSQSLEAWGHRLGELKGSYGKSENAWDRWTPEMQTYCEQDVNVTSILFRKILEENYSTEALALEMAFQEVIEKQEKTGVCFNEADAHKFYSELAGRRATLRIELDQTIPPWKIKETFIPKINNSTKGYIKGVPIIREKEIPFNPNSHAQISKFLIERYSWEPIEYTEKDSPKVTGETLSSLPYFECKALGEYLEITKIIGMVAEGLGGWLKKVQKDGRIHGGVITNGTVTGRCTHSSPNLGQVPKKGDYGKRSRSLFVAPDNWYMVGVDASGLELRMFSHYLARYDGGAYTKIVCEGDIHTENQHAAGLETRDAAKTFIYAYMYGASDTLLGSKKYPEASRTKQAKAGAIMRAKFLAKMPAIARLQNALKNVVSKNKKIKALDKRIINIRSSHSSLNFLLQSAGTIVVKYGTVIGHEILANKGLILGKDYVQVLHIHDEVQLYARTEEIAKTVGESFVEAFEEAGRYFKLRCPTTGEYKIGKNWEETH